MEVAFFLVNFGKIITVLDLKVSNSFNTELLIILEMQTTCQYVFI